MKRALRSSSGCIRTAGMSRPPAHRQNLSRTPPLTTKPSDGAHASTVHRPFGAGRGRVSDSRRAE